MQIVPTLNIGKNLQDQLEIPGPLLMGGQTYEVPDAAGKSLIQRGLATPASAAPPHVPLQDAVAAKVETDLPLHSTVVLPAATKTKAAK